jgi:hypothetical protein
MQRTQPPPIQPFAIGHGLKEKTRNILRLILTKLNTDTDKANRLFKNDFEPRLSTLLENYEHLITLPKPPNKHNRLELETRINRTKKEILDIHASVLSKYAEKLARTYYNTSNIQQDYNNLNVPINFEIWYQGIFPAIKQYIDQSRELTFGPQTPISQIVAPAIREEGKMRENMEKEELEERKDIMRKKIKEKIDIDKEADLLRRERETEARLQREREELRERQEAKREEERKMKLVGIVKRLPKMREAEQEERSDIAADEAAMRRLLAARLEAAERKSRGPLTEEQRVENDLAMQELLNEIEKLPVTGSGLQETKEEPMTDEDIKKYCPDCKILKYVDLKKYKKMSDILKDGESAFILFQDSPNSGHWCLESRYTDEDGQQWNEHFDSYGIFPDNELSFVGKGKREKLGIDSKFLTKLLKNDQPEIKTVYSYKKYQDMKPGSSTCGRWACLRRQKILDGLNLPEFKNFIEEQKKELDLKNNDDVVSTLVP